MLQVKKAGKVADAAYRRRVIGMLHGHQVNPGLRRTLHRRVTRLVSRVMRTERDIDLSGAHRCMNKLH